MILGIPTKNRTSELSRCVESFRDNARLYDRDVEFVVADDSTDTSVIYNHLALRKSGIRFRQYDRQLKVKFAEYLARESGVDLPTVRFALLPNVLTSMGAQRNFLTLINSGKKFLSVDDDMVCKFATVPHRNDEILVSDKDKLEPQTNWLIEHVDESLLQDEDFIAQHEKMLGGDVGLTIGGSVGDSGVGNAYSLLVSPGVLAQVNSVADLNYVMTNRQVLRSTMRPRIVNWADCTGMSMGMDASEIVPPFVPILRGEDTLFGVMMRQCEPHKKSAYCNYAMWHTPVRKADLADDLKRIAMPGFSDLLLRVLVKIDPPSLKEFGDFLVYLSASPSMLDSMGWMVGDWREKLAKHLEKLGLGLPFYLVRELQQIKTMVEALPTYEGPFDLPLDELRIRLRQVGDLFLAWPALFEAARTYGE